VLQPPLLIACFEGFTPNEKKKSIITAFFNLRIIYFLLSICLRLDVDDLTNKLGTKTTWVLISGRSTTYLFTPKVVGLDPGFGSSPTGLVLFELLKDKQKVIVRQTETYTKQNPNYIKDVLFDLYRKWWNLWILPLGCDTISSLSYK
jgi:hypothetical protein